MKYLLYKDDLGAEHVDIFSMQIDHKPRAESIATCLKKPIKVLSAGTVKISLDELDEFDVTPGSHTLGINGGDAAADATAIKHGLTFF